MGLSGGWISSLVWPNGGSMTCAGPACPGWPGWGLRRTWQTKSLTIRPAQSQELRRCISGMSSSRNVKKRWNIWGAHVGKLLKYAGCEDRHGTLTQDSRMI